MSFTAPCTGEYLAGIADVGGQEMEWTLTATIVAVSEPSSLVLVSLGLAAWSWRRR